MGIRLNRVMTGLAREEKKYTLQCEGAGRTLGARYHDINAKGLRRRPLTSCHHAIINGRNLGRSIGVHFREYRSAPKTFFLITYTTKGKVHRVHHPET